MATRKSMPYTNGPKRKPPTKYFDVRTGLQVKPSAAVKKQVAAARRKSK